MSRFVIRAVNTGVKFDLRAANGQTVLTSEVYKTEAACRKGIASVRKTPPLPQWRIRRNHPAVPFPTPSLRFTGTRQGSTVSA